MTKAPHGALPVESVSKLLFSRTWPQVRRCRALHTDPRRLCERILVSATPVDDGHRHVE